MKTTVQIDTWPARFDSHCFECEKGIHRGQIVRRVDGRIAHNVCPPDAQQVCDQCHLTRPCEHDEGA